MRYYFLAILCSILISSCKHDHQHNADGSHPHDHETHEHTGHDHESHEHTGHHHDNHEHAGHDHDDHHHEDEQQSVMNTLTDKEIAAGWKLLFDGKSITSWTGYQTDISPKWSADSGTLHFNPKAIGEGGDIITKNQYQDFELSLDWKISDCGNSGLFWNVVNDEKYNRTYMTGPEMQILDNKCHPDAKIVTHRSGDLYDMIETSSMTVKPAMQWNSIRVISKDSAYEFYQNGVKVVQFTMHTKEWDDMVANSKFNGMEAFGKSKSGHLALQDHGDEVWFRNIKIREI